MRGHTLIELLLVMLLLGIGTAALAPGARQMRDRAASSAAREAVVGAFAEARAAAIEAGGAQVHLDATAGRVSVRSHGATLRDVDIGAFGVDMTLSGGDSSADLRYDALGIGRVASQRIGFRRGDVSVELLVSSYGRVRRR